MKKLSEFLDVQLSGDHVGDQVSKIIIMLLISSTADNGGGPPSYLTQKWCINLLIEVDVM